MHIDNPTPFDVTALPMTGPQDRPLLTVIVKGTFTFASDVTELAAKQVPIAYGDQLYDDPEHGIRYESDIVPYKPCTDVVLAGTAHAPNDEPAKAVDVALKVGPVHKKLKVFGRRLWNHAGVLSRHHIATAAEPFVRHPIRYSDAFGGMDPSTGDYCNQNPAGKGFYALKTKAKLTGEPLPRIEDPRRLIRTPQDHPAPAGFGFYPRAAKPRTALAGTYDETWRTERNPLPPEDFDYRFYNGAHPELQTKGFLQGNEPVELTHLTPEEHVRFNLPTARPICEITPIRKAKPEIVSMNLDTVFLAPDERYLCLVWRGNAKLPALCESGIEQVAITAGHSIRHTSKSAEQDIHVVD